MQVVDRAYLILDGVEFECKTLTPKGEMDGADVVKVMNRRNRAVAHKMGVPNLELSVEIPLPEGGHAVNFWKIMTEKVEFPAVVEFDDGQSLAYYDCRIKSVEDGASSGEDVVTKLELMALDIGIN